MILGRVSRTEIRSRKLRMERTLSGSPKRGRVACACAPFQEFSLIASVAIMHPGKSRPNLAIQPCAKSRRSGLGGEFRRAPCQASKTRSYTSGNWVGITPYTSHLGKVYAGIHKGPSQNIIFTLLSGLFHRSTDPEGADPGLHARIQKGLCIPVRKW